MSIHVMNSHTDFYNYFRSKNTVLAFYGVLSKDILISLIERLKKDIDNLNVAKIVKKRFFSIVVECFQNISKHGSVSDDNHSNFLLIIEHHSNVLRIRTGNNIPKNRIPILTEKIELVNSKSKDELRKLYYEGILMNQLTEKGEAGLGFIDIARKSTAEILYKFHTIDEENTFFMFQTEIIIAN